MRKPILSQISAQFMTGISEFKEAFEFVSIHLHFRIFRRHSLNWVADAKIQHRAVISTLYNYASVFANTIVPF